VTTSAVASLAIGVVASAASFALGAALPMAALIVAPSAARAAPRVGLGGTSAIAVTALVGRLFGAVTG
jgi:VIT1/CCC1 family predicted Fe2+/Mn2+ transporter